MPGSVLLLASSDFRDDEDDSFLRFAQALAAAWDEVNVISVAFDSAEHVARKKWATRLEAAGGWGLVDGIHYFQWSLPWSSINPGGAVARWLTTPAYDIWAEWPCRDLDAAAARAEVIVVRCGAAAALIARLRRRAPHATIIYYVDDPARLAALHPRVTTILGRDAALFDHAVVAARSMLPEVEAFGERVVFVQRGIDVDALSKACPTPFKARCNVVALGSACFDASVVQIAANALPEAHFHLIGAPEGHRFPGNVVQHAAGKGAVAYLQHASVGLAPYIEGAHAEALADTSAALLQFGHLGVPAVCPWFAVGGNQLRVGYDPGRSASVREAFARALRLPRGRSRVPALAWSDVVQATIKERHVPANRPTMQRREAETAHGR